MNVDLFVKKVPHVVKDLISREAASNRRSINQETIALLEEALLSRVGSADGRRRDPLSQLERYAQGGHGGLQLVTAGGHATGSDA